MRRWELHSEETTLFAPSPAMSLKGPPALWRGPVHYFTSWEGQEPTPPHMNGETNAQGLISAQMSFLTAMGTGDGPLWPINPGVYSLPKHSLIVWTTLQQGGWSPQPRGFGVPLLLGYMT